LSIDAGGQSVRAALYRINGERLGIWQCACGQNVSPHGSVEQDAGSIIDAAKACLSNVPSDYLPAAAAIVSQGSSVVCWSHADGAPLSPVISWQDHRGEDFVKTLAADRADVQSRTGLPLTSHYGASKIRWCLRNLPEVEQAHQQGVLTAGPLISYLLFHLSNSRPRLVDSGSASRMQLWNIRDQQWDETLLQRFEVPSDVLPQGVANLHEYGPIDLGGRRVPLVAMNRDQQAAIFAGGRPRPNTAYVNLGTGAFIQCLVPEPTGPPELLVNRVLSGDECRPSHYSLEGTVHGAAGAVAWLEQQLGCQITPRHLRDALESEPAHGKTVYFVNGVMGMGSPYWRATCNSRFSDGLSNGEKLLAWLESLVFMLIDNLRRMTSHVSIEQMRVSGGLSNLRGLVQRLADLSGIECYCERDHEATLRGAAFLAAGQPDRWWTEDPNQYQPRDNAALAERYVRWQHAMHEAL
jgi:glycerol kinase